MSVESLPVGAPPPATASRDRTRRLSRIGPTARDRLATWVPPILVALLFLPFVLRENVWWELNNAYWFFVHQTAYVKAHGVPTMFINSGQGTFYPMPIYYGGFAFTVLSVPGILLGTWPAFVAATIGVYVAGYFGVWWTARSLGLSRAVAVLPALSFSCAPYLVGTFYGRGAWAEVVGLNGAAIALGATASLLLRPERSVRPAMAALVAGSALVAGTHNLTLLMSAVVLPLLVLALLPARRADVTAGVLLRQLRWVVIAVLVGVGLTAAFLLPDLWFGRETAIGSQVAINQNMLDNWRPYSWASSIFSPWPKMPEPYEGLSYSYPQFSVLAAVWTVVAAVVAVALRPRAWRRLASFGLLLLLTVALLLLINRTSWWPHFPETIRAIQMPVRLMTYVCLAVACAASVAIMALRPGNVRRGLLGVLAVVIGAQAVMTFVAANGTQSSTTFGQQAPRHGQITTGTEPASFSSPNLVAPFQFLIPDRPTATPTSNKQVRILFDNGATSRDATMRERGKVGDRIATPVDWSPYVKIDGDAKLIGRDGYGMAVIRVGRVDAQGYWRSTVGPICNGFCLSKGAPWQLTAGRLITFVSTLLVVGFGGLWLIQGAARWHRRRRGEAPSAA